MMAVGGAVVTLIIVALLVRHGRGGGERLNPAPSASADSTPAARSTPAAGAPSPIANSATPARRHDRAPAPSRSADRPGVRRYAQTWVNVRGDRTRSAPTVGMLNPGDAVTVDSLVRGWYRVVVDGRALGYVHRSTLDVSRPQ